MTVASAAKKDTGPATRQIDDIVLQLAIADVAASKQFYVNRGLAVAKSYGHRYVEFATGPVNLTLYTRRALAKVAGVSPDGTGSHRLTVGGQRRRALHRPGRVRVGGNLALSRAAPHNCATAITWITVIHHRLGVEKGRNLP